MNGIEIAEKYYNEYGRKLLDSYPELNGYISVGIFGSGSECFGFDDEISKDHDFEPGFTVLLPDEEVVSRELEFKLQKEYLRLPNEFLGYKRSVNGPVGGQRKGFIRLSDFLFEKTGTVDGKLSNGDYIFLPEYSLSEVINGKLFRDDNNIFTNIRNNISNIPNDVILKKIVGNLFVAHQSGIYNYPRCFKHHENGAAVLALNKYVEAVSSLIFNINKTYMPYYKWQFKAMRRLKILSDLTDVLEYLLISDNAEENYNVKTEIINDISSSISNALFENGFSDIKTNSLIDLSYNINKKIADPELRNRHILYAVN